MTTLLSTQHQKHILTAQPVCGTCQHACPLAGTEAIECKHPKISVRIGSGRDQAPGIIRDLWDTCDHHNPRNIA